MKEIKFNLSYANKSIKTLDELKDDCNIDLLLETLDNGLLARWLNAQGEKELSQKVTAIDKSDYRKATKELLSILFGKQASAYEQAFSELFTLRQKEINRLENLEKLAEKENEIITQYHRNYNETLEALKNSSNDYPKLKALMQILYEQFRGLLALDKVRFYDEFKDGYPLVLLSLIANTSLCEFFFDSKEQLQKVYDTVMPQLSKKQNLVIIKNKIEKEDPAVSEIATYIQTDNELQEFKEKYGETEFGCIHRTSSGNWLTKILPASSFFADSYYIPKDKISIPHIIIHSGKTDDYWKDLEPKDKTFMIISIISGNKLRNAGKSGEELTANDINGKFIFTNGIDYMSHSDSDKLIYMEI